MRVVSGPKQPPARPEPRSEGAILVWLDALAGGICPPTTFLRAMREQFPGDNDGNWEVLALLDQYYRLGKINADIFRAVKAGIQDSALGGNESAAAATSAPTATDVVFSPPRPRSTGPRVVTSEKATTTAPVEPPESPDPGVHPEQRALAAAEAAASASFATATVVPIGASGATVTSRAPPITSVPRFAPYPDMTPRPVASMAADPIKRDPAEEEVRRSAPDIGVGDVLRGRYKVRRLIGEGGMGTVFEAADAYRLDLPGDGQRIAIKVLHADVAKREERLNELQVEFQMLQSLSHPNIVRVHEIDRDGDIAFFTMELLIGTQLARVLGERNAIPLPHRYSYALIRDLGAALAYAHEHGVVHGDINPQNIFINNDGELRMLDFGATSKRTAVATPGYASCQVLEGQLPERSDDVFAFACVAYVLLSGQHPFGLQSALQARLQRLRPARPSSLSRRQWRVLREGLRWDREARPADVRAWLARLGLRGAAPKIPSLPALLSAAPERKSYILRAAAVFFVAVLIGAGFWATSDQDLVTHDAAAVYTRVRAKAQALISTASQAFTRLTNKSPAPSAAPQTSPSPDAAPATESSVSPATSAPISAPTSLPTSQPTSQPASQRAPQPAPQSAASSPPPVAAASARPHTAVPAPVAATVAATVAAPTPAAALAAKTTGHPTAGAPAPQPAAAQPKEPRLASPVYTKIELTADSVDVLPSATVAQVTVRRRGSLHGDAMFTLWTESGTAKPAKDFTALVPHEEQIHDGSGSVTVSIPVSNSPRTKPLSFYVVIDQVDGGPPMAGRTLTMVTLQPEE